MSRVFLRVALLFAVIVTGSCEREVGSPATAAPMSGQAQFQVISEPKAHGIDVATHVPGSLREQEAAAIASLLALYPPETARELEDMLQEPGGMRIYAVDGNEEAARLLSLIYSIRDADAAARTRNASRSRITEPGISVMLILADDLTQASVDAVVFRRASEVPANVIVLRRANADAALAASALAVLQRSRRATGEQLRSDIRLAVPRRSYRVAGWDTERLQALLRQAGPREVAGFGVVTAVELRLSGVTRDSPP